MLKYIALAFALLALQPAHAAEPSEDFLSLVKAQTAATRVATKAAVEKAKSNEDMAKKMAEETRAECSELIKSVDDLAKAEAELEAAQKLLEKAKSSAATVADSAKVRTLETKRAERVIAQDERPEQIDWSQVNESPVVTRARVVRVCKAILNNK